MCDETSILLHARAHTPVRLPLKEVQPECLFGLCTTPRGHRFSPATPDKRPPAFSKVPESQGLPVLPTTSGWEEIAVTPIAECKDRFLVKRNAQLRPHSPAIGRSAQRVPIFEKGYPHRNPGVLLFDAIPRRDGAVASSRGGDVHVGELRTASTHSLYA